MTKRRPYEPRIVGGKVISADLQRLHQRLLNSAVIEVSDEMLREVVGSRVAGAVSQIGNATLRRTSERGELAFRNRRLMDELPYSGQPLTGENTCSTHSKPCHCSQSWRL